MSRSKKFRRARLIVIVLAVLLVATVTGGGYWGCAPSTPPSRRSKAP